MSGSDWARIKSNTVAFLDLKFLPLNGLEQVFSVSHVSGQSAIVLTRNIIMDVELPKPKGPLANLMGLAVWVIDTMGAYKKRIANLNLFVRFGGMEGVRV